MATDARRSRTNGAASRALKPRTRRSPKAPSRATRARPGATASRELPGRLFDATGRDRDVNVTRKLLAELDDQQILWVDLADPDGAEVETVAELFELRPESIGNLRDASGRPRLAVFGSYV